MKVEIEGTFTDCFNNECDHNCPLAILVPGVIFPVQEKDTICNLIKKHLKIKFKSEEEAYPSHNLLGEKVKITVELPEFEEDEING